MGTQTTPPPGRAHTPPTPLHGPIFDSPRRSSRIHNKQKPSTTNLMDSPAPTSSRRRTAVQTSSQQPLSPPSSPTSPNRRLHASDVRTSKTSKPSLQFDTVQNQPPSRERRSKQSEPMHMYPTPMKTPRKRVNRDGFGNTSRVLFHDRETDPDQIMPTPSKSRRGKKHAAFSLESFESEQRNGGKVEIYTDSKERMPEIDEDEENPFVVKRGGAIPQTKDVPTRKTRGKRQTNYGMTKEIDEAVDHDEGMIYTFRGKKIYRPFNDKQSPRVGRHSPSGVSSDQEFLRRQAGHEARKPLTRSSIKPRLLFPSNDGADEVDTEEATTDIESPTRHAAESHAMNGDDSHHEPSAAEFSASSSFEKQRPSPFDNWPRTKPGQHSRAKRHGEPMEKSEKRTRSGHHSVQT